MKRLFTACLTLAMLLSLTACGGKGQDASLSGSVSGSASGSLVEEGDLSEGTESSSVDSSEPDASQEEEGAQPSGDESKETPKQNTVTEPEKKEEQSNKKEETTPAQKPAEKQEEKNEEAQTPDPSTQTADPLSILSTVWNTYGEDEKFAAAGGDYDHIVEDAPGSFDVSSAENLNSMLTFPTEDAGMIDSAASLMHMMNANTFTCGAYHVVNANDVSKLADDLHSQFQSKHWMCGFPDKLVVASMGQYVVSFYGGQEQVDTFRDKLIGSYPTMTILYDAALEG